MPLASHSDDKRKGREDKKFFYGTLYPLAHFCRRYNRGCSFIIRWSHSLEVELMNGKQETVTENLQNDNHHEFCYSLIIRPTFSSLNYC